MDYITNHVIIELIRSKKNVIEHRLTSKSEKQKRHLEMFKTRERERKCLFCNSYRYYLKINILFSLSLSRFKRFPNVIQIKRRGFLLLFR